MAQKQNLVIDQGADYNQPFVYCTSITPLVPINITSYTAKAQFKPSKDSPTVNLTLTDQASAAGQIILGGATGVVTISINNATTAAMTGSGVYDVKLYAQGGLEARFIEGSYTINSGVTV